MTSELDKLDEIIASIAKLAKEIYIIDECKTKQILDHCENKAMGKREKNT